jgi:hypothetical protein
MTAQQRGEEPFFDVKVEYDTSEYVSQDDPVSDDVELNWGFAVKSVVIETDKVTGDAIANSAGEIFVPPLEDDDFTLTCRAVRNESNASWNPAAVEYAVGKVNSNYGYVCGILVAPGQALLRNISSRRRRYQDTYYYEVTYDIEFDSEGFVREVLDQGTFYLDGGNKVMFRDGGELADRPHNLDGSGGALSPSGDPVYLEFDTKDSFDFDLLDLEDP